jgi:hypothetical protein
MVAGSLFKFKRRWKKDLSGWARKESLYGRKNERSS